MPWGQPQDVKKQELVVTGGEPRQKQQAEGATISKAGKVLVPTSNPPLCFVGHDDVAGKKAWLADIWRHTDAIIARDHGYVNQNGVFQPIQDISVIQKGVQKYPNANGGSKNGARRAKFKNMVIRVENCDCVVGAQQLIRQGSNPMLMDAASRGHFGGGYQNGSRAQEEELCRRSALANVVHPLRQKLYPLAPEAGIYCPPIPFFRGGDDVNYALDDTITQIAVGIVAAHNRPPLVDDDTRLAPAEASSTTDMVRTFFQMAVDHGHRSVVCVPLGCGAFKNPALHVAEIFMQQLMGDFKGCFEQVVFSVLDDHNSYHMYNPYGNYAAFGMKALEMLAEKQGGKEDVVTAGGTASTSVEKEEEDANSVATTTVQVVGPNGEAMTMGLLEQHAAYMKTQVPRTGNNKHLGVHNKKKGGH